MSGAVAGGAAFLVAGASVPLLVWCAAGRNLLDVPNLRSSHEVPTPRLGGLAIIAGTWVGAAVLRPDGVWPLLVAATLVGAVGLVDDLGGLHFGTKAIAQALVASSLILLHPPLILSEHCGPLKVSVFAVGVFWIVSLSNAFNFMDGIDGLIGGVALINFFLAPLAGAAGAVLPALAGATAGFLVWNISPARIFLGDSGSYFLGFGFATVALYADLPPEWPGAPGLFAGWSPLVLVGCILVFTPLLFDTAYTLARRSWARKDVFSAHREHIYQRVTPTIAAPRRTSNLYHGPASSRVSRRCWWRALALVGGTVALGCCGAPILPTGATTFLASACCDGPGGRGWASGKCPVRK